VHLVLYCCAQKSVDDSMAASGDVVRAGVFIGVDQTGKLQKLKDAAAAARRMYEWALAQGITDQTHAKLIVDTGGKTVQPDHIFDAVKQLIDGAGVDQLIIYFAGHGVNINRHEHWLLTEAPVKASAAVDVSSSVELATYCGIPHVVTISDACRVAPDGIQAQRVRGIDIFPNESPSGKAKPVDQFFACALGRTAAEVKDPLKAARNYRALYTTVLLEALNGSVPQVLEPSTVVGDTCRYVRPLPLSGYVEGEVPRRVKAMKLQHAVNQSPDAIVMAHTNWLARIQGPPPTRGTTTPPLPVRPLPTVGSITHTLVRSAALGGEASLDRDLETAATMPVAGVDEIVGLTRRIAAQFGPDHFETGCGIKVRGARITAFFSTGARGQLLGHAGNLLRIDELDGRAASVLLCFAGDFGTVIPVVPGFIAALTVEDAALIDVAYEPSANSERWYSYQAVAADIRSLRAIAAASSEHGRFRLNAKDAEAIARRMQSAKGLDLTLSIYAAYSFRDLQLFDRLRLMADFQRDDIGVALFDVALLSRKIFGKSISRNVNVVPFAPMLTQGWGLLGANRVNLHPKLEDIDQTIMDSLWSLFNAEGLEKLLKAMETEEVK
jgi:hypothetical protein